MVMPREPDFDINDYVEYDGEVWIVKDIYVTGTYNHDWYVVVLEPTFVYGGATIEVDNMNNIKKVAA